MVKVGDPINDIKITPTQANAFTLVSWKGQFRIKAYKKTKIKSIAFLEQYIGAAKTLEKNWRALTPAEKEPYEEAALRSGQLPTQIFSREQNKGLFSNRYAQGRYGEMRY